MKLVSLRGPRATRLAPSRARFAYLSGSAAPLLVAVAVFAMLAAAPARAQDVIRPLTEAEMARYLATRGDDPAARIPKARVPDGVLTAGLDEDSSQFIVPHFRVQTANGSGTTTLFAIRNTRPAPAAVRVDYFSSTGATQQVENYDLTGYEIVTRNVRDVPNLASADGFKTGFIVVTAPGDNRLSVDVFQVDPGNDFATGSRAVDVAGIYLCDLWDIRFLVGGYFSGGTSVSLLFNSPQGTALGSDPSAVFTVTDESGDIKGAVGLFSDRFATTVLAQDILNALGPGALPPSFGAFEVDLSNADGGLIDAVYDAEGRFSIGLKGSCVTR